MSFPISNKITADGSPTLYRSDLDEHYHSVHGARQESLHVFIETGLKPALTQLDSIRVLEMGFGTGLNALLTEEFSNSMGKEIEYIAVETVPLKEAIWKELDYGRSEIFDCIHSSKWEEKVGICRGFDLEKKNISFQEFSTNTQFNLIYWDAFAPSKQPELWTQEIFEKCYKLMASEGVLVTYCAKGSVRRAMQTSGFEVERLPGPPGKREMLRATKRRI